MAKLTLTQANTLIDTALAEGRKRNLAPLAVAVLDAGGHLIAFQREDKAGFFAMILLLGKPGVRWVWALARENWRSAPQNFRPLSPCWQRPVREE